MRRILYGTFAVVAVSVFGMSAASAQSDQKPSHEERIKHLMADREMMFHARMTGMKSGLGLTPEQEKLWSPFEAALNDLFKSHTDTMQTMMKARESKEPMAPADRMGLMADRMAEHASKMKAVAAAGKPLYEGLSDDQKHKFEVLSGGMMANGPEGDTAVGGGAGFSWEPHGWGGPME